MARAEGSDGLVSELLEKTGIAKGARTLDFGGGIGLTALMFQDHGVDAAVVEASRKYAEKHPSLGITSFGSAKEALEQQGPFDLVMMKDVLEHVSHPREVLAQLIACVKPGGYFYLRVPNVIAYRFHWSIGTKDNINHFTPKIVFQLLKEHGLETVDFIGVYDIRTRAGKLYHSVFWPARKMLPLYHQISVLFRKI